MKYKALFIDLDGTILDTLEDIASSVNFSLQYHGLKNKSLEQIRSYIGNGSKYLIKCAIDQSEDEKLFSSVFDVYKKHYLTHPNVATKPYDGVLETLTEFKKNGGLIALISNKPQDIATLLINHFFPNLFDILYGQMDNIKHKPDPESIYLAMKHLGLSNKKDILYVGDSLVDLATARNANLDCVLCNYGFAGPKDIVNSKNPFIDNFKQLKDYLY